MALYEKYADTMAIGYYSMGNFGSLEINANQNWKTDYSDHEK